MGLSPNAVDTGRDSISARNFCNERNFAVEAEEAVKENVREQGVVKFFDEAKGWGFITRPDTSELFVHFTSIQAEGFKTLQDGQVVTYTPVRTKKGWAAQEVVVL